MRGHVSAVIRRSLTLYTLAAALLATFMAGCGGVSSAQVPPTPYCQAHQQQQFPDASYSSGGSASYDPHFWRPGIIVVGLVSADNQVIAASDADVAQAVNQFLHTCFPNAEVGVESQGIAIFQRGTVAAAFLQLLRRSAPDSNDADLKTVIDAINSSDQTLGVTATIKSPFIDEKQVVIHKNSNGGSARTNAVIVGVSPDWNMNGQPDSGGFAGGSPYGSPSLDASARATQAVNRNGLLPGSGKTVYVLDTVPPIPPLSGSTGPQHPGGASTASDYCGSDSRCLGFFSGGSAIDVNNQALFDESAPVGSSTTTFGNAPICTTLPSCDSSAADIPISKHGFFVSAIIHNLAPGATIHLKRVLNDYGVGDLVTLINALSDIENSGLAPSDVIVNLSLSIEPPLVCLIPIWENGFSAYKMNGSDPKLNLSTCGSATTGVLTNATGNRRYQNRLLFPLGVVISDMIASRYTIVAAAGNDSEGLSSPYGADMPAAFCGVQVAAAGTNLASGDWKYTTQAGELASFSNEPYVIGPSGKSDPQCLFVPNDKNATSLTQIQAVSPASYHGAHGAPVARNLIAPGVGVCSLYLHVGDSRDTNDTTAPMSGEWMATWSGSSFATAMVSGNLAANAALTTWTFLEPCAP